MKNCALTRLLHTLSQSPSNHTHSPTLSLTLLSSLQLILSSILRLIVFRRPGSLQMIWSGLFDLLGRKSHGRNLMVKEPTHGIGFSINSGLRGAALKGLPSPHVRIRSTHPLPGKRYLRQRITRYLLIDISSQDPNCRFGKAISRNMTATLMMAMVGLLEKISASKAAADKKAKDEI